jgi:hypothetical protein
LVVNDAPWAEVGFFTDHNTAQFEVAVKTAAALLATSFLPTEIEGTQRIRLVIQIIVLLEILISCSLRLELVRFSQWAKQPSRTPRNQNVLGVKNGRGRLAGCGYAHASSTGLNGERF